VIPSAVVVTMRSNIRPSMHTSEHAESDLKRYFNIDGHLALHARIAADLWTPFLLLAEILHLSQPVKSWAP
jgi:hypothetical protein